MANKKKQIIKVIATILAVILLFVGSFGGYLLYRFNCDKSSDYGFVSNDYNNIYEQQVPTFDVGNDGEFDILKINDTHFYNGICEDDKHTLSDLKSILDKTPVDFIVVNGDLVEGFNLKSDYDKYKAIDLFADMIENYNIPWTFAPGNNDGEIDGDNDAIIAFMMEYPHFVYGNSEGVYGDMQFFVDLTYNGELAHSLAILDSGMRKPKAIGKYEYIQESQINWLLDGINERKVPTSVFFHMPVPSFESAFDNGEAYEGFTMYKTYPYTDIPKNVLFDDMTKDNEYISLISCAHQHSNNMCSFYEGRWYQLSSVSGYSAGRDDFIVPSVTLTKIDVTADNAKDMYAFEQITA